MNTHTIRDVFNLSFLDRHETLVISGSLRSDMNLLARALGNKAGTQGVSVAIVNVKILLEGLAKKGSRLAAAQLAEAVRSQLLIIENFGTRKLTPSQTQAFAEVLKRRVNRSSTIITSARPLGQWDSLLGGSPGKKKLIDSLLRYGRQVVIGYKHAEAKRKPAPDITVQALG